MIRLTNSQKFKSNTSEESLVEDGPTSSIRVGHPNHNHQHLMMIQVSMLVVMMSSKWMWSLSQISYLWRRLNSSINNNYHLSWMPIRYYHLMKETVITWLCIKDLFMLCSLYYPLTGLNRRQPSKSMICFSSIGNIPRTWNGPPSYQTSETKLKIWLTLSSDGSLVNVTFQLNASGFSMLMKRVLLITQSVAHMKSQKKSWTTSSDDAFTTMVHLWLSDRMFSDHQVVIDHWTLYFSFLTSWTGWSLCKDPWYSSMLSEYS